MRLEKTLARARRSPAGGNLHAITAAGQRRERRVGVVSRPVIITCALTGGGDTTGQSPYVPITPEQIAREALLARQAGAAIVHIHARDPATGAPSRQPALYRQIVE